jgi:hypothetical protein
VTPRVRTESSTVADKWTAQFRLSITRALADQLATTLQPLDPVPLTAEYLANVEARPGVYVLFTGGERVYVGKASKSLRDRLGQHQRKLSGRCGLDLETVRFVCVYVDEDLDAAAPEKLLIKKYRATDSIPWNTNGFGNKDPGRNRDGSLVKAKHFDARYAINLDVPLQFESSTWSAADLLETIKRDLPYLLRYDNKGQAKTVLKDTRVSLPNPRLTVRELAGEVIAALPAGWQLTALPGYLILYPETRIYDSALVWWRRRGDASVEETSGPRHFDAGEVQAVDDESGSSDLDQ